MLSGVERWVHESGVDLEFGTAHAFMAAGLQVQQFSCFNCNSSTVGFVIVKSLIKMART